MEIAKIEVFIEMYSQKCLAEMANKKVNFRIAADIDLLDTVFALTNKLIGSSLYSVGLLNKSKHCNITHLSEKTVNYVINNPHLIHFYEITFNFYEVKACNIKFKMTCLFTYA